MLPFSFTLKPGLPVSESILFAVRKAVVTGQLRPGDRFPSVRVLSQELPVSPNTAHKIVTALVSEGVLVTTPAVGSMVADRLAGDGKKCAELLGPKMEWLVVEAKKLGLKHDDVQAAVVDHWQRLGNGGPQSIGTPGAGKRRQTDEGHRD